MSKLQGTSGFSHLEGQGMSIITFFQLVSGKEWLLSYLMISQISEVFFVKQAKALLHLQFCNLQKLCVC